MHLYNAMFYIIFNFSMVNSQIIHLKFDVCVFEVNGIKYGCFPPVPSPLGF